MAASITNVNQNHPTLTGEGGLSMGWNSIALSGIEGMGVISDPTLIRKATISSLI